uniref:HU-CCDC81_euk_2 domain-containing protein n=1 Tax=Macrostomum lignano TaxID=282301 RepID=A0A1I8HD20_9PLAT
LFHIWEAVSRFIEKNLQNQKVSYLCHSNLVLLFEQQLSLSAHVPSIFQGVHIPNFGTFSFVQKKLDVGNAKYLLIQRPVFQLFERICQTHGLAQTKYHVTGSVPVVQLNYAALSVESSGHFDRDKIETCVRETLGALNRSIAMQRNVELVFCGVGRLQIRCGGVKFKFYKDFVNSLDRSGTVVRALQQRPGTADSVMSDRPASRAFSVALPKLPSRGPNGLAPINEDECVPGECAGVHTDRRDGLDPAERSVRPIGFAMIRDHNGRQFHVPAELLHRQPQAQQKQHHRIFCEQHREQPMQQQQPQLLRLSTPKVAKCCDEVSLEAAAAASAGRSSIASLQRPAERRKLPLMKQKQQLQQKQKLKQSLLPKLPSRLETALQKRALAESLGFDDSAPEADQRPRTERLSTGRQSALPVAMVTDFTYDPVTVTARRTADRLDLRYGDAEVEAEAADAAAAAAAVADADAEADKENKNGGREFEVEEADFKRPEPPGSSLPPPTPPQRQLPPPRPPSTTRLQQQQELLQQSQRPPSTASSCGHAGAGQELCYVCHQRARRNIPVSFAEELKRREKEEDQLLHAYNEMRDKERILKEQESLLAKRHDAQKVSAFNLGIAEAQKDSRGQRDPDNRPSYIFQARPLTPPRRIKQMALNAELERQVTDKKSTHDRVRADEAFLERLEQVQLAEDLAAQREQFLKDREEQKEMYKRALSAQLRYKPVPLPPREPDSSEPVFGRNDVTEEKLLERRRRAKEVAVSQLDDVNAKKREELLRRLQEQKYEEEVLRRTREDLVRDRAWRFDRMQRNRKGLEDDWSQAAQIKRDRELAEKMRASSPGGLIHEQCDNHRRCKQCKRRLNNSGETNVWCESYYVPGSRYLT